MSNKMKWLFPIIALFIYITLMVALLAEKQILPDGQQLPIALGLLAFSIALTEIFSALRIKRVEHKVGLSLMYLIHACMGVVSIIVAIAHIGSELNSQNDFSVMPTVTPTGFMAIALLILTVLTGFLFLSNILVKKIPIINHLKKKLFKREIGLWVHRLSLVAVLSIFAHMMSIDFVRQNTLLIVLSGSYVILAIGGYVISKVTRPRYILRNHSQHNSSVFELEFEPQKGKLMSYQPGQYIFVGFIQSELSKESHPFSISSSPTSDSTKLKVMIKNSGDYTSQIAKLNIGDIATLEGPYGSFWGEKTADAVSPIVMLAGGIGITPIISIIRNQLEKQSSRRIVLVWGLSTHEDLLMLHELQAMRHSNDSFSYHIAFSKEQVDGFDSGQITKEYLQKIEVNTLYPEADFFICGPAPMMESMIKILKDNQVDSARIHIEEFSF